MRKLLVYALAVAALSSVALAGVETRTVAVTNSVAVTITNVVSGYLDKIEISGPNVSAGSYAVVVASYDAGGTAIDTFASVSGLTTSPTVVRTRVYGTTNAGVHLTGGESATTNLCLFAERPLIGGNVLTKITPTSASAGGSVTVSIHTIPASAPLLP